MRQKRWMKDAPDIATARVDNNSVEGYLYIMTTGGLTGCRCLSSLSAFCSPPLSLLPSVFTSSVRVMMILMSHSVIMLLHVINLAKEKKSR